MPTVHSKPNTYDEELHRSQCVAPKSFIPAEKKEEIAQTAADGPEEAIRSPCGGDLPVHVQLPSLSSPKECEPSIPGSLNEKRRTGTAIREKGTGIGRAACCVNRVSKNPEKAPEQNRRPLDTETRTVPMTMTGKRADSFLQHKNTSLS